MMLLHGGRDDDIFIYQLFVFIFAKSGKGNELIALCLQLRQHLQDGISGKIVDIMQ